MTVIGSLSHWPISGAKKEIRRLILPPARQADSELQPNLVLWPLAELIPGKLRRRKPARQAKTGEGVSVSSSLSFIFVDQTTLGAEPRSTREEREYFGGYHSVADS